MERAIADLRQGVRDLAYRFELPALWSWWTGEFSRALPGVSRTAIQKRRTRPILAFASGAAVLWVPRIASGKLELVDQSEIPLLGDPDAITRAGHAAIEGLTRKVYGGSVQATKLSVALPPSQVLRKTLVLPAAVEENLRQAIEWDLDRHTPFPAEQLYFDAVVVGRDSQSKTIRVEWAAALRSHVDRAVRQAQSWGATVVAVTPEVPGRNPVGDLPPSRLNLLPAEARTDVAPWRRWQLWLPLAFVLAAIVAAVALPVWQKRERVIALLKEAAEARAQAAAADALRAELERATSVYNFALTRKFGFAPVVQLIEDVTRLLPDDTWLLQFELKAPPRGKEPIREVVLRGESASASRLVALLEESKLFEQASPRSPMTKIQPGPGEIFDIGAQLKPLPPPAMIELVAAASKDDAETAGATAAAPGAAGAAPAMAPVKPAEAAPASASTVAPAMATAMPPTAPTAAPAPAARATAPTAAPSTPVPLGTLPAGGPDPMPPADAAGKASGSSSMAPPRPPSEVRSQRDGGGS
jgi:general secretion pathway protein L